jgi:hypothetical protein
MKTQNPYKYRILSADKRYVNAGTGLNSWFTLEEAREKVQTGQMIVEHDGVNILGEVL